MAKSKSNIKTIVSIFLAITMLLCLTITVSSVEPRYSDTHAVRVQLTIVETTAYCSVSVTGADGTTSITDGELVLKDSTGKTIDLWDGLSSNNNRLSVNPISYGLTKGEKYTLSFSATANRNGKSEPISSSVSEYC